MTQPPAELLKNTQVYVSLPLSRMARVQMFLLQLIILLLAAVWGTTQDYTPIQTLTFYALANIAIRMMLPVGSLYTPMQAYLYILRIYYPDAYQQALAQLRKHGVPVS